MSDKPSDLLTEFDLISRFFTSNTQSSSVVLGVGDDCAVVAVEPGQQLVMSIDTAVEGRHFPASAQAADIATRAFSTALSDLAAMGAEPRWFTLALTLPQANTAWLQAFSESLMQCAKQYACELVGGDTTQGPLTISVQVHGVVSENHFLRRSAAKAGDQLYVTGCVGNGAAALRYLLNGNALSISQDHQDYLHKHFYAPAVQIKAGLALVNVANAGIDISDGLLADLEHIALASDVDIDIDVDCLPLSPACLAVAQTHEQAVAYALSGGDDYQIAFTVPAENVTAVSNMIAQGLFRATKIGAVRDKKNAQAGVRCLSEGVPIYFESNNLQKGYQHFAS